MGNFNQQLVALTMATLRADGKVDTAEVEVIKRVANDLECDDIEITQLLMQENEKQSKYADIRKYIAEVGKMVEDIKDKQLILEACIQVALADKVLDTKEVAVLLMICRALDCGLERLICNIAIFAQNDREIKIDGSDVIFEEEFIEEEN